MSKMKTSLFPFLIVSLLLSLSSAEQCGSQAGGALCPNGLCCSKWGWCGNTKDYCTPPDCQSNCWGDTPLRSIHALNVSSENAQCGKDAGGAVCPNGLCCSKWGFCGNTEAYCAPNICQPDYGNCWVDTPLRTIHGLKISSENAQCGKDAGGAVCPDDLCCSNWGFCGNTEEYCARNNCQPDYGNCWDNTPLRTIHGLKISSENAQCGKDAGGAVCPNGLCCSNWGFCGNTEEYCARNNCQPDYGNCWDNTPLRSIHGLNVSSDKVQCGKDAGGALCPNNLCCSKWGFCGTTEDYCKPPDCQSNCWPSSCRPAPAPNGKVQCGVDAGGALCPDDLCCSKWGFCGNTAPYCKPPDCQSNCWTDDTPHGPVSLLLSKQ